MFVDKYCVRYVEIYWRVYYTELQYEVKRKDSKVESFSIPTLETSNSLVPYSSNLSEFVLHPSVSLCSSKYRQVASTSLLLISKYLRPFSTQGVVKGHLFTQKLALNCSLVVLTKDPCRKTFVEDDAV